MFPLVRLFAVTMVVSMCRGTPVVTSGASIQMQQQPSQFQTFLCATGFENCISENMRSEFEEIKFICGADKKCLVSLSGTVGDMCSKSCADYSNQVSSEDVTLSRPDVTTSRFVKCMGECLGKDIADVEALFAECKFDVTCWEIKVGLKAIVCVAKCIKWKEENSNIVSSEDVTLSRPDVTLSRPDVTTSRFVKCMGECLGKSIADIEAWFAECKFDVTCWEKKVGFKAIKCVAKCIKWQEETSTFISSEDVTLSRPDVTTSRFVKCMGECLGKDIADVEALFAECKFDVTCWEIKVGLKAIVCVAKCIKWKEENSNIVYRTAVSLRPSDVTTSRFVKCMGECLGKSIADVEKWFAECKFDVTCWEIKVGFKAIKCVAKCIKWKEDTSTFISSEDVTLSRPDVTLSRPDVTTSRFVKCMGECLGKDIADVEALFAECKFDVTCWEIKVGLKAIVCVAKCIKWQEETSYCDQIENPSSMSRDYDNDFDKCFADCLRWSMANVVKWFAECQTDFECWLKVTGPDVIGCAAKCIKVPPVSSEVTSLSVPEVTSRSNFVKCMGKCLKKALPDIWKWFIECNVNVACWEIKAGVQAIACVAKCIKEQDETSYFDRYV